MAFLDCYVETYLKEEIIAEQFVRKAFSFRRFLDITSQMNAEILNHSKIGQDVEINDDTVRSYFEILN